MPQPTPPPTPAPLNPPPTLAPTGTHRAIDRVRQKHGDATSNGSAENSPGGSPVVIAALGAGGPGGTDAREGEIVNEVEQPKYPYSIELPFQEQVHSERRERKALDALGKRHQEMQTSMAALNAKIEALLNQMVSDLNGWLASDEPDEPGAKFSRVYDFPDQRLTRVAVIEKFTGRNWWIEIEGETDGMRLTIPYQVV